MRQNLTYPVSLLSFRAVIGGTLVTLSVFLSLLALTATLFDWPFDLRELPVDSSGYWISVFVGWMISVFSGGLAASWSVAPRTRLNGVLNSVVSWAASCIFVTTVLAIFTNEAFNFTRNLFSIRGPFWIVFIGNMLALGAAILAGSIDRKRKRTIHESQKLPNKAPLARIHNTARGTLR